MINVAAVRRQQLGLKCCQASRPASDIDKLVRFEVLSYGEGGQPGVRGGRQKPGAAAPSKVNWDFLERRIASSDKAYQRQIIRRKIDELVQYYEQCRQARDLPSIPGAVIISCDEKLSFQPAGEDARVGILKVPEREGILRAIDGQHRLLALHADIEHFEGEDFAVPAIIFDRLPEDHVVQMFVTINAKHTRLNASHLVSLSGRQLYRDEALARGHDVVRALNDRGDSPLYDEIKMLGVGRGRVAQAPLAQELKKLFAEGGVFASRRSADVHEEAKKFFVNYFKQIALVFGGAWNGRKYSIRSASALRAFVRVAPDVVRRLDQEHADRSDFRAIGRVIAPWGRRIGDLRFETEGAWKRAGTTVDSGRADIADRDAMARLFEDAAPAAVVNLAAETHVDRSIDGPRPFIDTNIVGTFVLLDEARRYVASLDEPARSAFRFLHVSTDEVYGTLGERGAFDEETPYAPNSPYAASKASADHLVRAYGHTFGLPVLITNCSNNYGPYQFPEKLIPLMILNALEGKPLPIYGDGGNVRDWLHVADHSTGLLLVLRKGEPGEKYNIGGGNERTNLAIVHGLCDT